MKWKMIISALIMTLGILGYSLYLNYKVNDLFAYINIQAYWEKPVLGLKPLLAIPFSIIDYRLEGSLKIHLYNLFWFALAIASFCYSLKKKKFPVFLSSILLWFIVPISSGSMLALPRYLSVQFPIFIVLGALLKNHKYLLFFTLSLSFLLLLILSFCYIKGFWIAV